MENIFNNIVDISKSPNIVNNNQTISEIDVVTDKITNAQSDKDNLKNENIDTLPVNNQGLSQNIMNINALLSSNTKDTNTDISSNVTISNHREINSIMTHINELNEKIIYYNTLATLKEKENKQLIHENKLLRTNLEIIKRRFNIR
jgi:hypothetical protein